MTKYKIMGTDKRYGMKDCYGTFDNLRDCTKHMDFLKRGTLGATTRFKIKEVAQ